MGIRNRQEDRVRSQVPQRTVVLEEEEEKKRT
jgi:hypothetical protein